ncbi:MAG: hypothetical protein Q9227_003744 [Pyrenula ochraceoflavens]
MEGWRQSIHRVKQEFDAVIIATGHYHACNIPDIPGLTTWKKAFPDRVQHSKLYRKADRFRDQNVLLVGAGVSSTDIARELGPVAKTIYQVSRGGQYDLPPFLLPENATRVGAIQSFGLCGSELSESGAIPGTVTLSSGQNLCDVHHVILCTGYHVSFPFMKEFHADGVRAEDADERVLVTDGQQTHNLHKDIFYISDPTLAFVGVPYHVATFSFFEFQAIAIAAVFAGKTSLPSEAQMRAEYQARLVAKGAGRNFHSMKRPGMEIEYVNDLVRMVNEDNRRVEKMSGHTQKWHEAYQRRLQRTEALMARKALKSSTEDSSRHFTSNDVVVSDMLALFEDEVFRYRYQHGTNLGSIYCLERWLYGSMFDENAQGGSELDAVQASLQTRGLEATRTKWESHWNNALSNDDLIWLTERAHCNCIRLPVGYFTLGPEFCHDTPFAGELSEVYRDAWASVRTLISRCYARGIGVLLDFHAVPGGANPHEHSGTSSGQAKLWNDKSNLSLATHCLTFIAHETTQNLPGVIGIQLCNESIWDPLGMYDWYTETISAINSITPTLPIYISDGWDLSRALRYAQTQNSIQQTPPYTNPVVVDTHKYWAFTPEDHAKSPQTIISESNDCLSPVLPFTGNVHDHASATATFVGEYSCALNPATWSHISDSEKDLLTKEFGQAQSRAWQAHACGSAFWTFKMGTCADTAC